MISFGLYWLSWAKQRQWSIPSLGPLFFLSFPFGQETGSSSEPSTICLYLDGDLVLQ